MTLTDPLFPSRLRADIEDRFRLETRQHPSWSAVWFAGVLSDITGTLPLSDSWRSSPPHTWADATDVIEPSSDAPHLDPMLLALEQPLDDMATTLIQRSFYGWKVVLVDIEQIMATRSGVEPGVDRCFDLCTDAIRWSAHRRRAYCPPTPETWLLVSGFTWSWRARWVADGEPMDTDEVPTTIQRDRIPTPLPPERP